MQPSPLVTLSECGTHNPAASAVVGDAVAEAAAATEEVKKLAAEVTRLVAELEDAQDQLSAVKVGVTVPCCSTLCTAQAVSRLDWRVTLAACSC